MASEVPPPSAPTGDAGGPTAPADAYERLGILETLCYGVVYDGRVYQASRSEPICMLELDAAFSQDRETLHRLTAEIENATGLQDANVLAPKGLYQSGESLYLLSEAQSGISLACAFEMLGILGLRLSAEAVLRLAGSVLAALDSASGSASGRDEAFHCHGLLIPENIFVAEGQRVLVRGFGLWAGGVGRLKLVGASEARYLTPSQNRAEAASARADLFSLGTILFEAVAGAPAFDAAPDEESVMSLRDSVEELQNQSGSSLQALYGIILSCLNANPPIPAFRTKLRTTVDTLFLGELARERVPKTVSLEELVARVRPRRPAVIKARSLALSRVEGVSDELPSKTLGARRHTAQSAPPTPASTPAANAADEKPRPAASPALEPALGASVENRSAFPTLWVLAIVAAVGIAVGVAILKIRPRAEPAATRPTALPLRSTPEENAQNAASWPPAALPTEVSSAATPVPTAAESLPTPGPTVAPRAREHPTPRSRPSEVLRKRLSEPSAVARRRDALDRGRPTPAAPSSSIAPGASAPIAAAREPTAVAPGSVVALETPGLTRPFLTASREPLRLDSTDARPSVERSVLLQILVDERGRVRANRILRADRIPPGFGQGVEKYLATLRFEPGRLGGVAVRVWMPFDLRFFAP